MRVLHLLPKLLLPARSRSESGALSESHFITKANIFALNIAYIQIISASCGGISLRGPISFALIESCNDDTPSSLPDVWPAPLRFLACILPYLTTRLLPNGSNLFHMHECKYVLGLMISRWRGRGRSAEEVAEGAFRWIVFAYLLTIFIRLFGGEENAVVVLGRYPTVTESVGTSSFSTFFALTIPVHASLRGTISASSALGTIVSIAIL